jgi:hypothetical protein
MFYERNMTTDHSVKPFTAEEKACSTVRAESTDAVRDIFCRNLNSPAATVDFRALALKRKQERLQPDPLKLCERV